MNTNNRIGRWSVVLGIMIVLNLFFNYALSLVYKSPEYNNFCPMEQVINIPDNQDECVAGGGQWTEYSFAEKIRPVSPGDPIVEGYCDLQYTCRQNFENANKDYSQNVFVILVILGALSVFVGNFFAGNEIISSGFSLAGILSFLIASARYWGSANDFVRVLILAIALGFLFWIAIKKFSSK
ncbi:MAG: hypothetical protein EXS69_01260 [Candidatus Zambryskibacteria bacterium]|nr:hypothetical protein [Candidatus Zambryskibacteria bacterium]